MNSEPLRLGSRKSPMAISQSGDVARLITERTGRRVEIVGVTTHGDVSREHLTQIGGTGVRFDAMESHQLTPGATLLLSRDDVCRDTQPKNKDVPVALRRLHFQKCFDVLVHRSALRRAHARARARARPRRRASAHPPRGRHR